MDDQTFWIAMRGGLLGLAAAMTDDNQRRSVLNMVAAIERRYEIGASAPSTAPIRVLPPSTTERRSA